MNWLLTVAYDGTNYSGWQFQPEMETIQGTLNDRLARLYGTEIKTYASSRTDSGVHALAQQVTFYPPPSPSLTTENVRRALATLLPSDIRVISAEEKKTEFHARHDNIGKVYIYILFNGQLISPYLTNYCWPVKQALDRTSMVSAAQQLVGTHDFTSLSVKPRADEVDNVRTLFRIDFMDFGQFTMIVVAGSSFLYKMVRRIVGYLVKVGKKTADPAETMVILNARERNIGVETAPPQGLFLDQVFYDRDEMDAYRPSQIPFLRLSGLPDLL